MSSLSSSMKCYLVFRLALGCVDFFTDALQSYSLLSLGHTWWGLLTLFFPVLAVAMSLLSVLFVRCRRGWSNTSMGPFKTAVLAARALATVCEGLFESGPELVLQTVVLFHGVHLEDFKVLGDPDMAGTWSFFRAILHIVSIMASFTSLVVTIIYYNEEKCPNCRGGSAQGDGSRFCFCVLSTVLAVLFRVFVSAVLFSVCPSWAALVCLSAYAATFIVYGLTLPGGWGSAAVAAYASLFAPSGYAKNHGHHSSVIQTQQQQYKAGSLLRKRSMSGSGRTRAAITLHESYSEVERAKINQESLVVRVRVSHGLFAAVSAAALVPYVALLEVFLFKGKAEEAEAVHGEDLVSALSHRAVLYATPVALLLLLIPCLWAFHRRVVQAREAARQWFAITPARNRTIVQQRRNDNSDNSYTQQLRAEEEGGAAAEAVAFNRANSEASTVRVIDHHRPSAPSLPESLPPPYNEEPHYAEPKKQPTTPSKLYPSIHPETPSRQRLPPGTSKCDGSCVTCELFIEGSAFRSEMTGKNYRFVTPVNCRTASVIYLVTCANCKKQYVGKTEQSLRQRHYGHRREVETASTPLGKHFAEDCGYASWRMQIIDQCELQSGLRRREGYWMKELMTLQPWGLNTRVEAGADRENNVGNGV